MSRDYLSGKDILVVSKPLAKALGLVASIVLRRVQHWLEFNETNQAKQKEEHFHDGRWWTYNGYGGWTEDLEIFSRSTVRRVFNGLEELGLLVTTDKYNKRKSDQTKWYTIDYDAYDSFIELWHKHGCPMYLDGKQSKAYMTMLNEWKKETPVHSEQASEPLSTVSRGAVHSEQGGWSEQTGGLSTVSREPLSTVSTTLPESLSERSQSEPVNQQSVVDEPVLMPPNMVAFEHQNNNRSHSWVKAYSKLLKKSYSASRAEMKLLTEMQQVYDLKDFERYAAIRLKKAAGLKMLFILQDLPNFLAAEDASKPASPKSYTEGKYAYAINNNSEDPLLYDPESEDLTA